VRQKGFAHLILLFIVVFAAIGGIVYWNVKGKPDSSIFNQYSNVAYVSPNPTNYNYSPTPTVQLKSEPISSSQPTPKVNTLYYGSYKGNKSFFFSTESLQKEKWSINDGYDVSPYHGHAIVFGEKYEAAINFKDFQNPKVVQISMNINSAGAMAVNSGNYTYVHVGNLEYTPDNFDYKSWIIKVDLNSLTSEIVKDNDTGHVGSPPNDLEAVWGDKYLVFTTWPCGECDAREPAGKTIYNIFDKQKTFKEKVGNLKFNLDNNTFSYQKLAEFVEKCDESSNIYCNDGKATIMKPSGQTYTEALP
jgi:hypothetical protein